MSKQHHEQPELPMPVVAPEAEKSAPANESLVALLARLRGDSDVREEEVD